jgi:pyruvate formate lyase activating enzyme
MKAVEVFQSIKSDEVFYKRSSGGVTLTGGEPLFQSDFVKNILSLCRQAGIHTAIETCGYADWETIKSVFQYADLVLFDLKHMNSEKHRNIPAFRMTVFWRMSGNCIMSCEYRYG